MAIFRKTSKFRLKRSEKNSESQVPNSGGFYDSSIRGKTYEEYIESPENRSIVDFDEWFKSKYDTEQSGPRLVKKR